MIIYTSAGFMCLFFGIISFWLMPNSIWNSEYAYYRTGYFLFVNGIAYIFSGLHFDKKQKEYLANPALYTESKALFKIPWQIRSTFFFIPVTWLGGIFILLFIYCMIFKEIPVIGNF